MPKQTKTIKENQRVCNLIPSIGTEKDWTHENAIQSGLLGVVAALPPSVDLRAPWWNIGDQEVTGSCVGWASTDGVMRYHLVKAGKLSQKEVLSPRCTWMASKEMDASVSHATTFIEQGGTSLKTAMDICRKFGVVTDSLLPFHINTLMYTGGENQFYATASQRRASAYFNLGKDMNKWRNWLAANGPILAGLGVDATWDNATATHGLLDVFQPNTVRGGHAVCIVGYTQDKRFIIRNSWGTSWGDHGFGYASEAYINAGFYNESYGITL